jgi:hypothetical protein
MTCRYPLLLLALTLGGCGADAPPAQPAARDPVMTAALQAPLLVDPDLSPLHGREEERQYQVSFSPTPIPARG